MTSPGKKSCIYGFDPDLLNALKEILYFAGSDPLEVEDVKGFSKLFKTDPPDIIVMSLEALEMLDFQIMVGNDPQFDKVAILVGTRDVFAPELRKMLETCATDFFLVSQPYHLKRLAMAVMAENPWREVPAMSGKLLLADANLERRIAVARSLRISKYDVEFAESAEDLSEKIRGGHGYRMVLSCRNMGGEDVSEILHKACRDAESKDVPWLVYEESRVLANIDKDDREKLVKVGADPSPETISFNVQNILGSPMKELRKSERLPYFTPVKVTLERIKEEIWGLSTDISENGLYIRTLVPPPNDTIITVSFKPPTGEGMVQMGARVAWRKEYGDASHPSKQPGFGLEFARISEPDKAAVLAGYTILHTSLKSSSGDHEPA